MPDLDEKLQQYLNQIENGKPLPSLLSEMNTEDTELASLLKLADAVRHTPHPTCAPASAVQRELRKSSEKTLPARLLRPAPLPQPKENMMDALKSMFRTPLGAVSALVVVLLALVAGLGMVLSGPANADAAVLARVHGTVEVASSPTAGDWHTVSVGDQVAAGQALRTGDGSSVTLAYYEGSRSTISSNALVSLGRVEGAWGKTLHVDMTVDAGKTSHQVVPFDGRDSSFVVHTASGDAIVHGTFFNVAMENNGMARYSVNTGKVQVTGANNEVFLEPGQATTATGDEVETPTYAFEVKGDVTAQTGDIWTVADISFYVTAETVIEGAPVVGTLVSVEGRILEDGRWVADSIDLVDEGEPEEYISSFTGLVEAIDTAANTWTIGGMVVTADSSTVIGTGLEVGDPVKVTFLVLPDNVRLALSIELLTEETEPEPLPTATAIGEGAAPDLGFVDDELTVSACEGSAFTATGTIANTAVEADDMATNLRLEYLVIKGMAYATDVTVTPTRFDTLAPGATADVTVNVTTNAAWEAAPDEAEIKVRVFVSHETKDPTQPVPQMTVTLTRGCTLEGTPSPTPEGTLTATPEGTPSATPSGTPEGLEGAVSCTGAEPHPTGTTLANEFGVPYEEIMGWFCQHFGFGEIRLVYTLSAQTGIPVEELFTMKASGIGWGKIKHDLDQFIEDGVSFEDGDDLTLNDGGDLTIEKGNDKDKDKDAKVKPTKKPKKK